MRSKHSRNCLRGRSGFNLLQKIRYKLAVIIRIIRDTQKNFRLKAKRGFIKIHTRTKYYTVMTACMNVSVKHSSPAFRGYMLGDECVSVFFQFS